MKKYAVIALALIVIASGCKTPDLSSVIKQPVTPAVTPAPVPAPVPVAQPTVLKDEACNIILKYKGGELDNSGQITYIKRVLTSRPFDTARPVCVQYNDASAADGERTVWKDTDAQGTKIDQLPTDIPIDKIVVWYEDGASDVTPTPNVIPAPIPDVVQPQPTAPPSGNVPDWNSTSASPSWSKNTARNYNAGRAQPGQYHGVITGFIPGPGTAHTQATNFRYNFRSHFEWDLNVLNNGNQSGCVNINVSSDGRSVSWSVNQ
ncbi:MAG: hypothetical protein WC736_15295 [Gallionella sp.]|jgi:hypothetical protein